MIDEILDGLTPEQAHAVTEIGTNIIVSAGAGSGKTKVLSKKVRYLVCRKGYKLAEFLILTFTNLAAAEMKDRIRKELIKGESSEANLVDSADICTFDAYSLNLVKKYYYLLGLDSNISIIDKNIIDVKVKKLIKEHLLEYYKNNDIRLEKLINSLCDRNDDQITSLCSSLYYLAAKELDSISYLDHYIDNYYGKAFIKNTTDIIVNNISSMINKIIISLHNLYNTPNINRNDIINDLIDLLNKDNDSLISDISNYDFDEIRLNLSSDEPSTIEFEKAYKSLLDYIAIVPKLEELKVYNHMMEEYATFFTEVVRKVIIDINEFKHKYNVYEFDDISKFALKILNEHDDIRNQIREKLKIIMIDEYQDTSYRQEAFVKLIENNNVFMVGDVKQSIYRFRNAVCQIFIDKYNRYKNGDGGIAIDLNKNFRSRKELLEDFNFIFSRIMTEEYGGANYKKDHIIISGNNDYEKHKDSNVNYHAEFIVHPKDVKEKSIEEEARLIALDIINKKNNGYKVVREVEKTDEEGKKVKDYDLFPVDFSDFSIIIDRGTSFDIFVKVFNEYQIPLFVEEDEDIIKNKLVSIIVNLLKLVKAVMNKDYESDEFKFSFAAIARSFIFEYVDNKLYKIMTANDYKNSDIIKLLEEFIDENNDLSLSCLLKELIYKLELHYKLIKIGDVVKNEIYLDTLLSLFENLDKLDYDIDDFTAFISDIAENGLKLKVPATRSELNSVRLLNIHKSKGLEYNIIYYPCLFPKFNEKDANNDNGFSSKYGLYLNITGDKEDNIIQHLHQYETIKDDISEKIRLLYVALTRACQKVIFVIPDSLGKDEISFFNEDSNILIDNTSNNFYSFIYRFRFYDLFKELNVDPNARLNNNVKIDPIKLDVREIKIDKKELVIERASKELALDTNQDVLDFGTNLHFIYEIMDFKNPNYDILTKLETKYVRQFLNIDINIDIKDGDIYKEYRFYDEINHKNGIIDLMIVYKDHIDIIDYKTKHIDDTAYDAQLEVYKQFIESAFKKEVNTYLYSIVDNRYRKTS